MHTPTKAQWQTVIDNFKKVLPMAQQPGHLNMSETEVNYLHACGTVHCVGGWYAVATLNPGETDNELDRITFFDGADMMAEALGFPPNKSSDLLGYWARCNPQIWGNQHGGNMFSDMAAYNNAKTLAEVITYIEGVRDRSPE